MKPLLQVGNQRALEMKDLYELREADSSEGVYQRFKHYWQEQLKENSASPSLVMTFFHAFGKPFLMAGFLKLIHDTALFVGPYLLNALIKFLNDPSQPTSVGLFYVVGLFAANLAMSICLRQYFW
jgi:ATP-binding cassette subfamily C (CFTR/MRP) protein 1